jgi:streptogramin lyase
MNKAFFLIAVSIALASGVVLRSQSKADVTLTGRVSSEAEGPMEGVLVSMKPVGGAITVTVVSDQHGRYAFPAGRLKPGKYNLTIRAIGYDSPQPGMAVIVGANRAEVDLKLVKTRDLASQLSSAEWLMSVPGTPEQKDALYGCITCHTATPILKSKYDAAGWMSTILRMRNFAEPSSLSHPVTLPYRVAQRPKDAELAEYLSSINLSSKAHWDFALKTLPRPTGKATQVIITEYDLPRPDAEPHDVVIDDAGMVWYGDFAVAVLGRLNPRTGETKEWPLEEIKPGYIPGSLNLALDRDGRLWIARFFQGGVARFDKKTEKVTTWSIPPEFNNARARTSFLAIAHNGTVWFDDTVNRRMFLLDPVTGKIAAYPAYPGWSPPVPDMGIGGRGKEPQGHFMYGVGVDSRGAGYWADMAGGNIAVIDSKTGKVALYPTPTVNSGPRRLHIDSEDRLWFGENYALKIGLFDIRTKQFKEWDDPTPWDAPYDAVCDKAGYVWTGGMTTDLVTRLNPKTGEITQYLLPSPGVNIRRVEVDDSTTPPTFWVGENHQAKIAKVEPLE